MAEERRREGEILRGGEILAKNLARTGSLPERTRNRCAVWRSAWWTTKRLSLPLDARHSECVCARACGRGREGNLAERSGARERRRTQMWGSVRELARARANTHTHKREAHEVPQKLTRLSWQQARRSNRDLTGQRLCLLPTPQVSDTMRLWAERSHTLLTPRLEGLR